MKYPALPSAVPTLHWPHGLLQRESASILNASLHRIGKETVAAFRAAFTNLGMTCPLYLTQNDGTLMSADYAERFPVFTIASGPTNSMRGAAFLTGLTDAAVIDIGGTTTDIGMLVGGFPRSRSEGAVIAGVHQLPRAGRVLLWPWRRQSGPQRRQTEHRHDSVGFRLPQKRAAFWRRYADNDRHRRCGRSCRSW